MAWDLILWILSFFITLALLASTFYQLLSLSDLEADHLNPFETSARINYIVVPDFLLQGLLCALFLVTWHWVMFLLTLPLTAYNFMLYMNRRHLIDVTEVFRHLNDEKRYRFVKLGFYLILFTVVMFRLTLSAFNALNDEDDAGTTQTLFSETNLFLTGARVLLGFLGLIYGLLIMAHLQSSRYTIPLVSKVLYSLFCSF